MCAASSRDHRSHPSAAPDDEGLLRAERDIKERLRGQPLDFTSMLAVSDIYRAASAVRRRAERDVLSQAGLSWGGFTILWVLWIWGEMETSRLAAECDLAKGTLTGMLSTLEKQNLVVRRRVPVDRRRVAVALTDCGSTTIAQLFPRFNAFETEMTDGLSEQQQADLAKALRRVITNAGDSGAPVDSGAAVDSDS